MMYVGFFLLAVAVAAVIGGFLQRRKLGKIISTPFKKTGDAAGTSGEVSCEGAVQVITPLTAPCSGRPCIYYEVEVKQKWEKQVSTENGTQKKTGTRTAHKSKAGSVFQLDDGSGAVNVDPGESVDGTFETSFEGKGAGHGYITFGQYQVAVDSPEGRGTSTHCTEKIIPAEGSLFVLGQATDATIRKPDGMLGSLMLSTKGRDHLMGATKRNMMIAFVVAGLMLPAGAGMAIFGEAPASAPSCDTLTNSLTDTCEGRLYGNSDVVMSWTVTEPGAYRFRSVGTGTDVGMRLWPSITVVDTSGVPVFTASAPGGQMLDQVSGELAAGEYTIRVNDVSSGHAARLEGGAGFTFDVDLVTAEDTAGEAELPAVAAPPTDLPAE